MKDNLKIGLLGVIALTLVVDTFLLSEKEATHDHASHSATTKPKSNIAAASLPTQAPDVTTPPPAPPKPVGPTTSITFTESEYDYGNIKQDTENKHVFTFTNTGNEPLIISNAKGSCGCTVPEYPKEPIAPGATGEIKVVYKPGKQKGAQTKTVTVTANTQPADTRIQIKAQVEEVPS